VVEQAVVVALELTAVLLLVVVVTALDTGALVLADVLVAP
jgi:hypothetical protein